MHSEGTSFPYVSYTHFIFKFSLVLISCFCSLTQVSINNVNLRMMQVALAGMNVGPCTDHPCSSGYIVSADDSQAVNFPEMSLNNFGVPPCGDHGICKPHLDNFTCECPLFSSGDRCQYQLPLLDAERRPAIPGFTGDSFLHFENDEIAKKYGYHYLSFMFVYYISSLKTIINQNYLLFFFQFNWKFKFDQHES